MSGHRYSLINAVCQKIGSTRLGGWFFARTLHHLDRAVLALTRGRTNLSILLTGFPEVIVTTIGAKSGQPRTLPLVFIRDESDHRSFALIASNFGQPHNPAWYYNLKAHPTAICALDGQTSEYVAREATGEEYAKFWQAAVDTYFGYALYKQRASRRHIPIMVLTPTRR